MNSQKIVVLGKSSYVGRCLVAGLEENSNVQLVAAGREECDLLDPSSVKNFFSTIGKDPCTIVLLACVNKWVDNSYEGYVQNIAIVRNLIDATLGAELNIKSLIFASSADVYGRSPQLPITEQTAIDPDSWYGLGKYVCEWILASEFAQAKCPLTTLRFPGVYGEATRDRSVIGSFVQSLKANETVFLTGGGNRKRDYLFVRDLSNVIQSLALVPYEGIVNVASGESLSLAECVRKVSDALETEARIVETPVNVERDFDLVFDITLLKSLLPEYHFTTIDEGVNSYGNPS